MAVFAKYDGIDGEAKDADHDKWVDVLSLDWGAHRADVGATGQTRRRGSAVVEDMVLTFSYEKAAPKLLEKCLKGEVIPKLELELIANSGDSRVTYLKYELKNVMVTSYDVSASGNDESGPPTVTVANSFEELEVTYSEFDETGAKAGDVQTMYKRNGRRSGSAAAKSGAKKASTKKASTKKAGAKKSGGQKRKKTK